jgi:GNAT superfamily N-acetyltransferase
VVGPIHGQRTNNELLIGKPAVLDWVHRGIINFSSFDRGSGIAAALIADAEARLSEAGVATAWLACAIGNDRAARFYEKRGWRRVGIMLNQLETPNGIFSLEVWRYEKSLTRPHHFM